MSQRPSTAEVYRHDLKDGAIRRQDEQRVLAASLSFVQGLHFTLVETLGDAAPDVVYRIGYEWSLQEMLRLNQRMHDEFGSESFDFWQMDAKFVLDAWWAPMEAAGWGSITSDLAGLTRGIALIHVTQSTVAAALSGSDQPVCHLYAGMFAGAFSFFAREERHAVELDCAGAGSDTCKFVIGLGADIDSAESWRQQGVSAAEITQRLR
jgi:predicted hydrocarbon binding protein